MSLGGINETWTPLHAPLQWVPYFSSYHVSVQDVNLVANGKATKLLSFGSSFLVDSGSTFTYFTTAEATALRSAVQNACASGQCGSAQLSGNCWYNVDSDALGRFPTLRFAIGVTTFDWAARGYLVPSSAKRFCYAFRGSPPRTFGASFMRDNLFVFDRDAKRIGFARASCPFIDSRLDVAEPPNHSARPSTSSGSNSTNSVRSSTTTTALAVVALGSSTSTSTSSTVTTTTTLAVVLGAAATAAMTTTEMTAAAMTTAAMTTAAMTAVFVLL